MRGMINIWRIYLVSKFAKSVVFVEIVSDLEQCYCYALALARSTFQKCSLSPTFFINTSYFMDSKL